ncbi:low affinity immunoglobulin epsilon Fc receptor-like [Drosophila gunungcola]|uniref:low affinity immunoglobulin epsilon Fc receptor-like n=1 Tax=Drosophila gunungcola TaxID=103775 RepID=UPI0022E97A33|nr:low affinity immunoglobulin epsilon Fc receptor-like [Drosophila gunungcola]
MVRSQDSCSVCVVKDAPTQCGAFVHSALFPLYDHNHKVRQQLKMQADVIQENQKKLENLNIVPKDFLAILNQIKEQQDRHTTFFQNLEKRMIQQAEADIGFEIDLFYIQNTLSKIMEKHKPTFERIGSRNFYIGNHIALRWTSAKTYCRHIGGYLASIQSEKELADLTAKLIGKDWFWLGTNDREKEGQFVSGATGLPAKFLKWDNNAPKNITGNEDCVLLEKGLMRSAPCNSVGSFICEKEKI